MYDTTPPRRGGLGLGFVDIKKDLFTFFVFYCNMVKPVCCSVLYLKFVRNLHKADHLKKKAFKCGSTERQRTSLNPALSCCQEMLTNGLVFT
jgi:hypothetical protein